MNIFFKWIGGASWILSADDIKIACDPVLCEKNYVQNYKFFKSTRLNDPVYDETDFRNVNLWLLTHNHEDHIDSFGLKIIEKEANIVAHKSVKEKFHSNQYENIRYLEWLEESIYVFEDTAVKIIALPAIHAKKAFWASQIGNGNGYFIEILKHNFKYFIYVTGDSVFSSKLNQYLKNHQFDLFVVNAGAAMVGNSMISKLIGRITNNNSDILQYLTVYTPKTLIPVHWGTFSHYTQNINPSFFSNHQNIRILEVGETINLQ